jgi:DNA-binding response OmpR family regulator
VTTVLLATDSDDLFAEVDAALASDTVRVLRIRSGRDVVPVVEIEGPDLVVIDLQIGTMGGIAACLALRQEEGAGRLERRPVALLLDREADVFLAQESGADGWLVKPLDALRLRRLSAALLAGDTFHEGTAGVTAP